jgi:transaldolase
MPLALAPAPSQGVVTCLRFYLLTAHESEARRAAELGFIEGVFVPRAEVVHAGRDYSALIAAISAFSFTIVAAQAEAFDAPSLVQEAARMAKATATEGQLAFSMPMTLESVKAASQCQLVGAKSVLQLVSSLIQALIAARAGVYAIILDAEELGAAGIPIFPLVSEIRNMYTANRLRTKIFVEGLRDVADVSRVAVAQADGAVCTWSVLQRLANHPVTDRSMERLLVKWNQGPELH